jgi:manganese transport protein
VELLVVGAHGHKGFSDWLYGSTIDELRHRLNISVLGRAGKLGAPGRILRLRIRKMFPTRNSF